VYKYGLKSAAFLIMSASLGVELWPLVSVLIFDFIEVADEEREKISKAMNNIFKFSIFICLI